MTASIHPSTGDTVKKLLLGSLFLALCAVSGCGANADSLVKEDIKAMNDLAEALETNAPEAKVKELRTRLEDTNKKLAALKLSDDDKKTLVERHKDELVKAQMRFVKAQAKGIAEGGFPGLADLGKMTGFPGAGPKVPVVRYDSIAVLPLTGDPRDEKSFRKDFLEAEFPEALAREIAKIRPDGLKVIAPAVVREKQSPNVDLKNLGQLLGAKTLLIGKATSNKTINFQLIVAENGVLLWGDEIADAFDGAPRPAIKVAELVVQHLTSQK
jgi:TolB-like protein